jgi:ethanolamine utilization cobalamin adenosyltransferase
MDLHFHPLKIQVVQKLLPHDLNMQRTFCTKLLEIMDTLLQFIPNLITSDEANFFSDYVHKQNFRYWAEENLHLLHQSPLHRFEDNGHAVTVTAECYVAMLNKFLLPELR